MWTCTRMYKNTNPDVNLNSPSNGDTYESLVPRAHGLAAGTSSLSLTTDTPGALEATAGHPLGARLLGTAPLPTADSGALKSRLALPPPDLVFSLGLVFVDFFKKLEPMLFQPVEC